MNDEIELKGRILESRDILQCISILESAILKETSFDYVKICIFDKNATMKCLTKNTKYEKDIMGSPSHFLFNCMLYRLKELPAGIVDSNYLTKNNLRCELVDNKKAYLVFVDLSTYKKIGIIVGINYENRKIENKDISVLNQYAKKYTNIINIFRRLDERKDKIDYLTFLADINKKVPQKSKMEFTMKRILYMISKTFNFDLCVFIQHDKGEIPKKIKGAVKSYYSKEGIHKEVITKVIGFDYPVIDKINKQRIKNNVFGSSFSYLNADTEIKKYFDEFVIVPLNELDESKVNYIICLNRLDKKSLNKRAITQLIVFQNQILSTLKNIVLVNDIKEDYKQIKDLHRIIYRLNFIAGEEKIIQRSFYEMLNFFNVDCGAVYCVKDGMRKLLFSKNIDSKKDISFDIDIDALNASGRTFTCHANDKEFVSLNSSLPLKSQILILVSVSVMPEYLFILQSRIDYIEKRKYKILSKLISVTNSRILENARMHSEIMSYNEILLKDKKMLSEAIAEDRERLFNIVNGMDEPLIAISPDWTIEIFNDASENMFATDKENIVKTDAKQFIKKWKIPITTANHGFKKNILEFTINDRFYKIIKTPYNTKFGRPGAVLVFEDITKEREIEEIKNEFISLLSHEMKTPLTSITGFSKLFLAGKLGEITDQQKDCIDVIFDEGERLKNLVEEILDLDRLEKGKLTINKSLVNLFDVFNDVIDNKIMLKNRNVKIVKNFQNDIQKILVDEDKIRQVLINLVSNAIKFTDDGGTVTVKLWSTGKEIVTSVSDTGVGIKQEDMTRIFEKFYQVQSHLTRSQGGVGLGLSIVKKILDLHNGHIDVKSKLGKGSTFTFYLPI